MAKTVTPGAISLLLSNPSPDSPVDIVVQVVDLKPVGNSTTRFTFSASDGTRKLKAMLPTHFAPEVHSGNLQNLGLIRILDYTLNAIPNQPEKALIVWKCEVVSSSPSISPILSGAFPLSLSTEMAKTVTPRGISLLLSNPSPDSPADIVVQVVDLKPVGTSSTRFTFSASDGTKKLKAMFPTHFASEINSGNLRNLGLIRILDYTLVAMPNQPEKGLVVVKCEVVSPSLDKEIKTESKKEEHGIILKPKQDFAPKFAAQIVLEHRGNAAPAARMSMSMSKRVHPLVSLNPYQGDWTIKVRVTNKGTLRPYRNAKGEGCVFNVELTDEDGTQIQATMFDEAAKKFYLVFELGKVYYVSKGSLKVADRQFRIVAKDYEMTLNEYAIVEEAEGEVFVRY